VKKADFWVVAPCSLVDVNRRFRDACYLHHYGDDLLITLMMEAASTSEMSVNIYQTAWLHNPEVSHLHTRRRDNLKYHTISFVFVNALSLADSITSPHHVSLRHILILSYHLYPSPPSHRIAWDLSAKIFILMFPQVCLIFLDVVILTMQREKCRILDKTVNWSLSSSSFRFLLALDTNGHFTLV
jgi:hypothetical protein